MASATQNKTTDHNEIKSWIEDHKGEPAQVKDAPGLLRVRFQNEDDLEKIEWGNFFELFEENDLAFIYQEGDDTTFCKFISRD